MMMIIVIFVAL